MEMIQVHASCEFLYKLRVRSTAFRKSGFIRGQIAGDNIRRARNHGAKIPPAAQVCCGVDSRRLLAEVHRKRSIVSSAEAGSNAGNRTAGWPRRMADKEKPRPLACIIGAVPVGITPRAHPGVAATAGEAMGMLACLPSNGSGRTEVKVGVATCGFRANTAGRDNERGGGALGGGVLLSSPVAFGGARWSGTTHAAARALGGQRQ
jgi:hypothetical protein